MIWLAFLIQLQWACLNTSFSPMEALLQLTLNTTGKICVEHGIPISPWNLYSSRSKKVLFMERQGGSLSVRRRSSRLCMRRSLKLGPSTVPAAVGTKEIPQNRPGIPTSKANARRNSGCLRVCQCSCGTTC
jgi:hypothetical protein